jgi:hypothetical protein
MSIFNTAYNTTACSGMLVDKIQKSLLDAYFHARLTQVTDGVVVMTGLHDSGVNTPVFNYPIILEGKDTAVFDARTLIIHDERLPNGYRVRNEVEFRAKTIQAALALRWSRGEIDRIRDASPLPLAVYSGWMGEVLAKRFALDARTQLQLSVIAAIFYINCFAKDGNKEDTDTAYLFTIINRACGYRHDDLVDIVEAHPIINDVAHLCEVMKEYTQNVRLRDLNPATLYGSLGGSWWGNNGLEAVSVGIEYPPVWMAIVFQALTDQGFKRSVIGSIVLRNTYRKTTEMFLRQMLDMAGGE